MMFSVSSLFLKSHGCAYATRWHFSSSYEKEILKKFLLQVHPDYFTIFQTEQKINDGNLKIITDTSIHADKRSRSLIFYIKPTHQNPRPRRVKVTTSRMIESVREILETIGVDLPVRPEGTTQSYVQSDCDSTAAAEFIEQLIDRKELIQWRLERTEDFRRLLAVVRNTLGVVDIDIRYSWSAQNNISLLYSLLEIVASHSATFCLPWRGMTLVLSADDCTYLPVDAIESHIMINPAQVPAQWLEIFRSVDACTLAAAGGATERATHQRAKAEHQLSHLLQLTLQQQMRDLLLQHSDRGGKSEHREVVQDSGDNEARRRKVEKENASFLRYADGAITNGLTVKIRRGHTCSKRSLLHFYDSMAPPQTLIGTEMDVKTVVSASLVRISNRTADSSSSVAPSSSSTSSDEASSPSSPYSLLRTDCSSSSDKSSPVSLLLPILAQLPFCVDITVEEGHGSKLLPTGSFRVDCRASVDTVMQLFRSKVLESAGMAAEEKELRARVYDLRLSVMDRLGIVALEAGVGVDSEKMLAFLTRVDEYLRYLHRQRPHHPTATTDGPSAEAAAGPQHSRGRLRNLQGLRVKVGRYLGIADDGACILPWDCEL